MVKVCMKAYSLKLPQGYILHPTPKWHAIPAPPPTPSTKTKHMYSISGASLPLFIYFFYFFFCTEKWRFSLLNLVVLKTNKQKNKQDETKRQENQRDLTVQIFESGLDDKYQLWFYAWNLAPTGKTAKTNCRMFCNTVQVHVHVVSIHVFFFFFFYFSYRRNLGQCYPIFLKVNIVYSTIILFITMHLFSVSPSIAGHHDSPPSRSKSYRSRSRSRSRSLSPPKQYRY